LATFSVSMALLKLKSLPSLKVSNVFISSRFG
jgi:hypothetical protein